MAFLSNKAYIELCIEVPSKVQAYRAATSEFRCSLTAGKYFLVHGIRFRIAPQERKSIEEIPSIVG